jgi:hypothetical protein
MTLTFNKYFETYTNYHSFTDLMNLAKEVADYVYNHDVTKSQFFDEFKETKDGFVILFNRSGKKNYFIDAKKEKVFDEKKDAQFIDAVYEDIENLFNILKNYELEINIKQMDEKIKTFGEIVEKLNSIEFDYGDISQLLKSLGWKSTISIKVFNDFENSKYFNDPATDGEYADQMHKWLLIEYGESKLNEGFEEELKEKLSDKYMSLKKEILRLLNDQLKGDVTKVQSFIEDYIKPESTEIIEQITEDSQIFDTYLKFQPDIDQILADNNYYDDPPEVNSLYDYVIDGTYDAIVYCMEDMKKELYGNE